MAFSSSQQAWSRDQPDTDDARLAGRAGVWRFFAISHGFSWIPWIAAAVWADGTVWESSARWLVYLGGLGPLAAGLWMTYAADGTDGLRTMFGRVVDPRRIPRRWLAVALLLPPVVMAAAVAAAALTRGLPGAVDASRLAELSADPFGLLSSTLFVLVFGPLPEEIGWRGYALDALQIRMNAVSASLILGAAWAVWHAPLFFIGGYYGASGPPDPVQFTAAIIVNSVLYTWIYNHTDRSVLVAIIFHFMINFVGMLIQGQASLEWTRTGITAVIALIVVAVSGPGLPRRRGVTAAPMVHD